MMNRLAIDWLKTKEFQEAVTDVMRLLRNFMGNKTFLITHMTKNQFTVIQSNIGSIVFEEGFSYSSDEAIFPLWRLSQENIEPVIIEDTHNNPSTKENEICKKFNIRSYIGIPLYLKNGKFFGTLNAIDNEPYQFTSIEVDTMKTLGNLMTKAIELHRMSVLDYLTGLYNKAFLERHLEHFWKEDGIVDTISAVLFDVDDFKTINDKYGHTVGDNALKYIGQSVLDIIPDDSTPFRFGGDEFCIFFYNRSSTEVIAYVETLRKKIAEFKGASISLSIGISDTNTSSHDSLLDTADVALYQAKRRGKNRYSIYGSFKIPC